MSDERLRDLERLASAGEADAALALAAALDRLGRADEGLEALLPAREDARVRRALAARGEAWALGGAKPVRAAPRVRWVAEPFPGRLDHVDLHPLGPLVRHGGQTLLLDGETGAPRPAVAAKLVGVVGEVGLHVSRGALLGSDLWTGERLFEAPLLGAAHRNEAAGSLLVRCARGWVRVEAFDDPRQPPGAGWQHQVPAIVLPTAVVSGQRLVVAGVTLPRPQRPQPHEVRALDLDGNLVWQRGGDGRVLVHALGGDEVLLERDHGLACVDGDGATRWEVPGRPHVLRVGSEVIALDESSERRFGMVWVDRRTGAPLHREQGTNGRRLAIARDVVTHVRGNGTIHACTARGEPLWTLPPTALPDALLSRLWAGHERLYVRLGERTLACLGP